MKRTPLRRRAQLRARTPLRRTTPLTSERRRWRRPTASGSPSPAGPASSAARCTAIDPAHLIPRVARRLRRPALRRAALPPTVPPRLRLRRARPAAAPRARVAGAARARCRARRADRRAAADQRQQLHREEVTNSGRKRSGLMLELVRQQRLERRPASRALPGALLGAMHAAGEDLDRVFRCSGCHVLAVAPVRDATDHDGVDVEPEAEREHAGDGSAARRV